MRWWSRLLQEWTETSLGTPAGRGKSQRNLETWAVHDLEQFTSLSLGFYICRMTTGSPLFLIAEIL